MAKHPYLVVDPDSRSERETVYLLRPGTFILGRSANADIRLEGEGVADEHLKLFVAGGNVMVSNLSTTSVTVLNDQPLATGLLTPLKGSDNLRLRGYMLYMIERAPSGVKAVTLNSKTVAATGGKGGYESFLETLEAEDGAKDGGAAAVGEPAKDEMFAEMFLAPKRQEEVRFTFPTMPPVRPADQEDLDRFIYGRIKPLFDRLVQERFGGREVRQDETRRVAIEILQSLVPQQIQHLPFKMTAPDLVTLCIAAFMDYGPLQTLLADERVTEIMVNNVHDVFIEMGGKLYKSHYHFPNEQELRRVIEKMVAVTNRHIDESQPYQDTRLEDGSRVNVTIRPVSLKGDTITIRKFPNYRLFVEDLEVFGSLSPTMSAFLRHMVLNRANVIISGGTGSGKTTLLNVLSSFIPETERVVTIEDAAELRLDQPNLVSLESKPRPMEGGRVVTIRDLVINALRMRPDRIVVGECRGGEAIDMLQAMNTGHEGSLTTLHANAPRDALNRLETMVLMAGMELPVRAIRSQVESAIDFVVQIARMPDGSRRLVSIEEIAGLEGDQIVMQEIFKFERTGMDERGKIKGRFVATGVVPNFVQRLREANIDFPLSLFKTE